MKEKITRDEKQKKLLERIATFRLLDDDFMTKCFEDNIECTQLVLHIVMDRTDLTVKEARSQYGIKNLQGRSVRLDVYAVDSEGTKYNIEVQRGAQQARPKRARYNSSLMDTNAILPGEDVEQLPETYIILITENDYFGESEPIYHIHKYVKETGEIYDDGTYIIYVNGAYQGDSPVGKLIHDFNCMDPADMNYPILAKRVRYFKEEQEGIKKMSKTIEELRAEWVSEWLDERYAEEYEKMSKKLEIKAMEVKEQEREMQAKQQELKEQQEEVQAKQQEVQAKQQEVKEQQEEVQAKQQELKERELKVQERQLKMREREKGVKAKQLKVKEIQKELEQKAEAKVNELVRGRLHESNIKLAEKLLKSGHSFEEVADFLEITAEEVKEMFKLQTA